MEVQDPSKPPVPWYLGKKAVWLALILVGPLALPFLWLSPLFSVRTKVGITVFSVLIAFLLWKSSLALVQILNERLKELKEMGVY